MRTTARFARRLAIVAVLAVAVTSCELPFGGADTAETESTAGAEDIEDVGNEPPAVTAEETSSAALGETTQDDGSDGVEEGAPVSESGETDEASQVTDTAPEEPLATVAGSEPFVELDILDLRRDGDAVTLVFSILVGEGDGFIFTGWVFAAGPDQFRMATDEGTAGPNDPRRFAMSGVTLVDRANANRHLVLRDSEGHCLCTRFEDAEAGQRYIHSAQFPAPPADVDSMTVEVPQFPSIDNVPIREAS